jgi:hypothetical protein
MNNELIIISNQSLNEINKIILNNLKKNAFSFKQYTSNNNKVICSKNKVTIKIEIKKIFNSDKYVIEMKSSNCNSDTMNNYVRIIINGIC